MHGIYLTEVFTTIAAAAIFGTVIHKLRLPANNLLLWLAAALALPLQPLVFFVIRVPLDHWLVGQLGPASTTYKCLITFYAPLTEEPAKLIPLLIPAIRRDISARNFVRYAVAVGVGFAIGEMWFVADRAARMPDLAALPFYEFGGYVTERLMTCVFHSAFVAVALWRLRRRFALGFAGAVALHWLGNFPLSLMAWNVGGFSKTVWMVFIQCFLLAYFVAALAVLCYFTFRRAALAVTGVNLFYGERHCPECDGGYPAPLFALNFGRTRYERCPHCRHWHWTKTRNA
jgi:hypothetical protein